jgi:hypothetical protein
MAIFTGGCHCGALRVRFQTDRPPAELPLRECACAFCRRHAATTATDTEGRLEIKIVDVSEAVRYRFGERTADFLICGRCGVYVAAVMATKAGAVSTLNVNVLDNRPAFTQEPQRVDYGAESVGQKMRRRAERWTVTSVVVSN